MAVGSAGGWMNSHKNISPLFLRLFFPGIYPSWSFLFSPVISPLESSIRPFIRLSANITNFTFSYVFLAWSKRRGLSVSPTLWFTERYWWEVRGRGIFRISRASPRFFEFFKLFLLLNWNYLVLTRFFRLFASNHATKLSRIFVWKRRYFV